MPNRGRRRRAAGGPSAAQSLVLGRCRPRAGRDGPAPAGRRQRPLRIAAVLAILAVVLIGLSSRCAATRSRCGSSMEDALAEEIDDLHRDVRKDIASAARQTHQALGEKLQVVQQQLEALRGQLEALRGGPARSGYEPASLARPGRRRPGPEPRSTPPFGRAVHAAVGQPLQRRPVRRQRRPRQRRLQRRPRHGGGRRPRQRRPRQRRPRHGAHGSAGHGGGSHQGADRHTAAVRRRAVRQRRRVRPARAGPEPRRGAGVVHTETFQVTTSRHTYVGERGAEASGNVYGGDQSGNVYGAESYASEPSGSVYGGGALLRPNRPRSPGPTSACASCAWGSAGPRCTPTAADEMHAARTAGPRCATTTRAGQRTSRSTAMSSARPTTGAAATTRWGDEHRRGRVRRHIGAGRSAQRSAEPTWQPRVGLAAASRRWTAEPAAAWGNGWDEPEPVYDRGRHAPGRDGGPPSRPTSAGTAASYLSMSPTTKNIEPRIAIRSGTRQPGSSVDSACTLAYDAVRSFIRHGVFSPRDTR